MIPVQIKRLHDGIQIPTYATRGAACVDLRAELQEPIFLHPGEVRKFGTGLAIYIEDPAYCGKIYPRSGLGTKGIVLANGVGIVDADYQGEVIVALWNRSDDRYEIQPGERMAQMCCEVVERFAFQEVSEFVASERGDSGFGSTGR